MNARAPSTKHPDRVHYWYQPPDGASLLSLCGGIEAARSFLLPTPADPTCPRCVWKLEMIAEDELREEIDEDHEAALDRERTYEFRRPRTAEEEELYRQARPSLD